VVALGRDGFDRADIQLARHNGRRHKTAPGNCHYGVEGADAGQAPRQGAAITVELVPGDGEGLLVGIGHGSVSWWGLAPDIVLKRLISKAGPDRQSYAIGRGDTGLLMGSGDHGTDLSSGLGQPRLVR